MRPWIILGLPFLAIGPLAAQTLLGPRGGADVQATLEVQSQSRGCIEIPRGAPMGATVSVPVPNAPRSRAAVTLQGIPSHGTDCIAVDTPPQDVLRGHPAPGGLLQGDPTPPRTRVTISPR